MPRMTRLGQKSIMHIILIYELMAKVLGIKANQIVQNSPKANKNKNYKKKREKLKNLHKNEKLSQK